MTIFLGIKLAKKKNVAEEGAEAPIKNPMAAIFKEAGFVIPPASELVDDDRTIWIDTGSYTLNAIISGSIYGGVPSDSITAIAGEKATGKTYIALTICKNFLERYPNAQVVYFDTEWAVKVHMLADRGIPQDRFYIRRTNTMEDFRFQATSLVNSFMKLPVSQRPPMLFVLDSLGMISTEKEIKESGLPPNKAVKDMTKSQLARGVFRVLTIKLGDANIPLIITAHTWDKIGTRVRPGMPVPKEMGGGEGAKYAASTIIFLAKKGIYDEDSKEITGNELKAKLYKSRYTRDGLKANLILDHIKGLDRYHGLFDIAKAYEVVVKKGNCFVFPDGQEAFTADVANDPEKFYTKETLDLIDAKVKVAFKFGSSIIPVIDTDEKEEEEE